MQQDNKNELYSCEFEQIPENTEFLSGRQYRIVFATEEKCREAAGDFPNFFHRYQNSTDGVLNFKNYIGEANFLGKTLQIANPDKITSEDFESMLWDLTKAIQEMIFGFNTPVCERFDFSDANSDIIYHSYIMLQYMMQNSEDNIKESFESIFRNPSRKSELEHKEQDIWNIRNVNRETVYSILDNPQCLVKLQPGNFLNNTDMAQVIRGTSLFPIKAREAITTRSLDTAENRFIKYFIEVCLDITEKFIRLLTNQKSLLHREKLFSDAENLADELEQLIHNPIFNDVGQMLSIPYQSTVLQKREEYKKILRYFILLQNSICFSTHQMEKIVCHKDAAELYELWTFIKVNEIVEKVLKLKTQHVIKESLTSVWNEKEITLSHGAAVCYKYTNCGKQNEIKVYYNKTYSKSYGTSYSLQLRPDIVIEKDNKLYILDAKFKLDKTWAKALRDDGGNEGLSQYDQEEKCSFTFKNGDIYKMHTYKDAIAGVQWACILYPDRENEMRLFAEDSSKKCGVGAIPLYPGGKFDDLEKFIHCILFVPRSGEVPSKERGCNIAAK